jgi:uncharacterized protein (DUF433 family)
MSDEIRIVRTPGVCGGRARLDGHRITVAFLEWLRRRGESIDGILAEYPRLTAEKVRAAWDHADAHPEEVARDLEAEAAIPGISRTPAGSACIQSTRIAVWLLEAMRRRGVGEETLLRTYPSIGRADLRAAWDYVAAHREEIDREIREHEEGP